MSHEYSSLALPVATAIASASLLGVLVGGYAGSGNATLGDPYLFEGLAAVIVGGTRRSRGVTSAGARKVGNMDRTAQAEAARACESLSSP